MNSQQPDWGSLYSPMLHFIESKVKNKEIAEDILHDSFLKVQQSLPKLKNSDRLLSWIYTIIRNTIQDHYRNPFKTTELKEASLTEEETNNNTWTLCVEPMLRTLSPQHREILELNDLQGLSQIEISKKLTLSYSTTKSRIQRARKKLKTNFISCCNVQTDSYGNLLEHSSCKSKECSKLKIL